MATVMIGNARLAETGGVNGSKGDQTAREVMTQPWSTGGVWQYVIRPKSSAIAKKIASSMVSACNNNNIGYSQADRLSLYNLASKNGFNLSKVGKCNCDCSSLVAVCVNSAGIKVNPSMYTGNELSVLRDTGKFTVYTSNEYTHSSSKLKTGDILLRQGHTAIVTQGAETKSSGKKKSKKSVETIAREVIDGKWDVEPKRSKKLKEAGCDAKAVQKKVNELLKAKTSKALKVGAKIKIKKGAKQYGKTSGFAQKVYSSTYRVSQISGNRVVFSTSGGTVMGAVRVKDCVVI